ncbi:MAG: M23 family metallopeptidase [Clostridia bacterium]|jgi:murein DD-endopeptidase MepM/ murein hydrolase activator NlpD|nr:M23 family metallopeptidase [Clostridia bacterium]
MSTSIEDIGATAFNFLSLKVKAIILGIIIGLFFLIIIPVLLIAGLFTTDNNEDTEETTTSSVVSGEVISDEDLTKYAEAKFIIPFAKWDSASGKITSKHGYRIHPVTGVKKKHTGMDLVSLSSNKIVAAEDGVVSLRTYNNLGSSFGNGVEILHTLPDGTKIYTFYAHMKDGTVSCKVGDTIKKGEVIGIMGSTGLSTGDHLHFEVRTKSGYGNDINPAPFLFGNILEA